MFVSFLYFFIVVFVLTLFLFGLPAIAVVVEVIGVIDLLFISE